MVMKGEYLTQVSHTQRKKGYVFEDYRPGQIVYHYTNIVIGTNLHLQTMSSRNSSKSWYFFPYSENKRLKDNVGIRGDHGGLVERRHVGSQVCGMHGIAVLRYNYVVYIYMPWFCLMVSLIIDINILTIVGGHWHIDRLINCIKLYNLINCTSFIMYLLYYIHTYMTWEMCP